MAQAVAVSAGRPWSWGDFFRGRWNLLAVPIGLICLVTLTKHLIEWSPLIDFVAEKYATWMTWVFRRSPIRIRSGWNDYIVLVCVVFLITNVGYYRRTGKLFITDLLSFSLSRSLAQGDPYLRESWQATVDDLAAFVTGCITVVVVISLFSALCFLTFMSFFVSFDTAVIVAYAKWALILAAIPSSGLFIAWRWIVGTALLFALLAVGNELYIHWLATTDFLARLLHNCFF